MNSSDQQFYTDRDLQQWVHKEPSLRRDDSGVGPALMHNTRAQPSVLMEDVVRPVGAASVGATVKVPHLCPVSPLGDPAVPPVLVAILHERRVNTPQVDIVRIEVGTIGPPCPRATSRTLCSGHRSGCATEDQRCAQRADHQALVPDSHSNSPCRFQPGPPGF